jgi:hypothetical protein
MSRSQVTRIILKTQKPAQLLSAFVGCLIGFLLIITSVQSYLNFKHIFSDTNQSIGSQYLVINKNISVLNSVNQSRSTFNESQIEEIRSLPAVKRVSVFVPNHFPAYAEMQFDAGDNSAVMKTDLFLESVNDSFVDAVSEDWVWQEGQETVPVILPADFINLYNFTYAPARGLPQLSKNTTQLFKFQIRIDHHGSNVIYYGKIVGFSNRITSMIVPMSFMSFANAHYGTNSPKEEVFRLIVEVKPERLAEFQRYLNTNSYETNEELLKSGKVSSLMQALLSILLILGAVMLFNAFSGFLLYLQLVVARSHYELETLLRLGFRHSRLTAWYANGLGLCLLAIASLSFVGLLFIHQKTIAFMESYGFEPPQQISSQVVIAGIMLMLLLYIIFLWAVRRQIYRLALPGTK